MLEINSVTDSDLDLSPLSPIRIRDRKLEDRFGSKYDYENHMNIWTYSTDLVYFNDLNEKVW